LLDVGDLDVGAGTCLAVLGPNGAGKSTLLRTLGLLTSHRVSGQVLLDGVPATPVRMRADAAAVLQRAILRRGTVASNVASGLRFRGVPRQEAERRAQPWLDALGIAGLADRDVGTLSGGEAQRACIARALATDPRVLLLDEPFGGLDAPTRADLIADLRAVLAGRPIAVVLVTHDVEEARALAADTALLIRGELRQLGPTTEILDAPADLDTARLLGFVNALPPELTGEDSRWVAKPEHCRVRAPGQPPVPATMSVAGTVRRHIALGPVTRIDVAVGDGLVTCLHPVQDAVEVEIGQSAVVDITTARRLPAHAEPVASARSG
jgi:ABC-type sulfate/molybdate transport systems ATPase subunit